MLGKSWWIENYKIIFLVVGVKKLECVLAECFMTRVVTKVVGNVAVSQLNCLCATVYRVHNVGTTTHGVYREAACITEHVENRTILGILLKQASVFALVNKEAGFLATKPVDMKLQSVLHSHIVFVATIYKRVFMFHISFEGKRCFTLIIDVLYARPHNLNQRLADSVAHEVNAYTMGLHNGGRTITINHQARNVVALAMNQSIGVVVGIVGNRDCTTHVKSRFQTRDPEPMVYDSILECKYAHGDGTYLVHADSNKLSIAAYHTHKLALFHTIINGGNGS